MKKHNPKSNDLATPDMVVIPSGEFVMGSSQEQLEWLAKTFEVNIEWLGDDTPQHKVNLPEYSIGIYPVTNKQYQDFVQVSHYPPPPNWEDGNFAPGWGNHPVVNVSWLDAQAYCKWLSEVSGGKSRLPTETEWEKAARGSSSQSGGRIWPWGNKWVKDNANTAERLAGRHLDTMAAWRKWHNSSQLTGPQTTPVGMYSSGGDSPYGLADVVGNVWEWVADWYMGYPKTQFTSEALGEKNRVARGGSWWNHPMFARCAERNAYPPDDLDDFIGFRIAE